MDEYRFTLSENETKELVELSERLRTLRNDSIDTMAEGNDEQIREKLKAIIALSEEINDLYKRTIVVQMINLSGDALGRCVGYHFQLTEAVAVSMAQICMSPEERAALNADAARDASSAPRAAVPRRERLKNEAEFLDLIEGD
jgi:hypothetical protein